MKVHSNGNGGWKTDAERQELGELLRKITELREQGIYPNAEDSQVLLNSAKFVTSATSASGEIDTRFSGNYGSEFTFEVGKTYHLPDIDAFLKGGNKFGYLIVYKPRTNKNGVERMYFKPIRKGFFNKVYELTRIDGKNGIDRILQPEQVIRVNDENGETHMEFVSGQFYGEKTLEQYLVPVETMGRGVTLFETKANNGNGHYYFFSNISTSEKAVYIFLQMQDKKDFTPAHTKSVESK